MNGHLENLLVPVQLLIALPAVLYLLSLVRWRTRTRGRPLPPGPGRIPMVGNLFNRPRSRQWLGYRDLSRKLGDVLYLEVLGQPIVVLGSAGAIVEYLNKRSANTSDRVQTPMIKLSGAGSSMAFMPYGQWWRRHRRAFSQYFHRDAVPQHEPTLTSATHIFLEALQENPSRLRELVHSHFASSILKVVYGIDTEAESDTYVTLSEEALSGANEVLVPGKCLVEFLPFLRHIPPWFPGATSQRLWAEWMAAADKFRNIPFEYARTQWACAQAPQSVVAKLLSRMAQLGAVSWEEEEVIKNVGASAFEGAIDTVRALPTYSTRFPLPHGFRTKAGATLLAMFVHVSLHPEVLRKAHAELDAVVGPHRMPDIGDRDSLVYVNAVIKETMRWHPAVPICVPHATVADDEFRGYFIPAGTMLIANTWACMRDPEVYEDPDVFRPERFVRDGKLDSGVRDPVAFVFGYGRRICPGRHFGEAALFVSVACVLHVFDIGPPPLGEGGRPVKPVECVYSDTLISFPEDCRCTIKPRSAQSEALIRVCAVEARSQSGILD